METVFEKQLEKAEAITDDVYTKLSTHGQGLQEIGEKPVSFLVTSKNEQKGTQFQNVVTTALFMSFPNAKKYIDKESLVYVEDYDVKIGLPRFITKELEGIYET
jgi:hypothetical protein